MDEFPKAAANQNEKLPQEVRDLISDLAAEVREVRAFMEEKYATIKARSVDGKTPTLDTEHAEDALRILSYLRLSLTSAELAGNTLLGQPKNKDAVMGARELYRNLGRRHDDAKSAFAKLNI